MHIRLGGLHSWVFYITAYSTFKKIKKIKKNLKNVKLCGIMSLDIIPTEWH